MPLTIWEPRKYVAGFSSDMTNGDAAAAPFDRDTLVREVARFEGWTQRRYSEAGEFELTIEAGQVSPADIRKGLMVTLDGDTFILEDYEWELTEAGYLCTISGRDLISRLDGEVPTWRNTPGIVSGTPRTLENTASNFFSGRTTSLQPTKAGWLKDKDRKPAAGWVAWEVPADFDYWAGFSSDTGDNLEVMTYGALLTYIAAFFEIGYRVDLTFDDATGLHAVQVVFYKPEAQGITMHSTDRGVSGFKYSKTSRDSVNAVVYSITDKSSGSEVRTTEAFYDKGTAQNWAEVANAWSQVYADFGEFPEEVASISQRVAWLETQARGAMVADVEAIEFSYNNAGVWRCGVDFGLGSIITVVDEFLSVSAAARIHAIRKNYAAGDAVQYDLELGARTITQADKLKKKFAQLERKTITK